MVRHRWQTYPTSKLGPLLHLRLEVHESHVPVIAAALPVTEASEAHIWEWKKTDGNVFSKLFASKYCSIHLQITIQLDHWNLHFNRDAPWTLHSWFFPQLVHPMLSIFTNVLSVVTRRSLVFSLFGMPLSTFYMLFYLVLLFCSLFSIQYVRA